MMNQHSELGALLRVAREERYLSIEQAGKLMHIRPRYLEALETGRFEDLPGMAYARGYLQTYATFLELDKDEIFRRFDQVEAIIGKRGFFRPQAFSKDKTPHSSYVWGGMTAALALYMLWNILANESHTTLSVVDAPPAKPSSLPLDRACFTPIQVIYPPCHVIKYERTIEFPLESQRKLLNVFISVPAAGGNETAGLPWRQTQPLKEDDEQPDESND